MQTGRSTFKAFEESRVAFRTIKYNLHHVTYDHTKMHSNFGPNAVIIMSPNSLFFYIMNV